MRIGVAVDGSSPSRAGVELVSGLALRATDEVSVIAVAESPAMLGAMPFGMTPVASGYVDLVLEAAQASARQAADNAAGSLADLPCRVTSEVRVGHPVEALLRAVADLDLDLLVLGSRGRGGLGSMLLGSVSQGLLQAMPTSILIARPPTGRLERVIVAADGSPQSLAAASFLSDFPLPADADIRVLVSVTSWTEEYRDIEGPDYLSLRATEGERARAIAERVMAALGPAARDATPLIRDGDPKREIVDAARALDANLVVTGSRGLGGFRGLVLGSVSRGVSIAAPCSVLVVGGPKVAAPDEHPPAA